MSSHDTSTSLQTLFTQVCGILGLSHELRARLVAGDPIVAPSGFVCRIHTQQQNGLLRAFPEIIIPMSARELGGDTVVRLLGVQETLLTECGWRIGMSEHGLLTLLPLFSENTAESLAALLDRGQLMAHSVLTVLSGSASTGDTSP